MITDEQLNQIMPTLPQAKRQLYLPALNATLQTCAIDNPMRTAAFLAQLAHESVELRYMEEIWGPTAAQLRYEPPGDSARRLGNTQAGDGKRFKGRGPIQITGRFNYKKYGELLKLDLIAGPEQAATPEVAFQIAGLFWTSNGLNALADAAEFTKITQRINGGQNGALDREKYYAKAKNVLADGFVANTVSRGARAPVPASAEPLTRGPELLDAMQEEKPLAKKARAKAAATRSTARKAAAKHA